MIPLFTNATVRSASDLLADLTTCRPLRHLDDEQRASVVEHAFKPHPVPYREPKEVRSGIVCADCGRPRSQYSASKCQACYRNTPKDFAWTQDAFSIAVSSYGYCCDACEVVTTVPPDRIDACAIRILQNMDGHALPMLCAGCSQNFLSFCTREFGRDGRAVRSKDFEKLNLAWIASQVRRAGEKVRLGFSAKDRRREST